MHTEYMQNTESIQSAHRAHTYRVHAEHREYTEYTQSTYILQRAYRDPSTIHPSGKENKFQKQIVFKKCKLCFDIKAEAVPVLSTHLY